MNLLNYVTLYYIIFHDRGSGADLLEVACLHYRLSWIKHEHAFVVYSSVDK